MLRSRSCKHLGQFGCLRSSYVFLGALNDMLVLHDLPNKERLNLRVEQHLLYILLS
jgi:hypothetical protein